MIQGPIKIGFPFRNFRSRCLVAWNNNIILKTRLDFPADSGPVLGKNIGILSVPMILKIYFYLYFT